MCVCVCVSTTRSKYPALRSLLAPSLPPHNLLSLSLALELSLSGVCTLVPTYAGSHALYVLEALIPFRAASARSSRRSNGSMNHTHTCVHAHTSPPLFPPDESYTRTCTFPLSHARACTHTLIFGLFLSTSLPPSLPPALPPSLSPGSECESTRRV